MSSNYAQNSLRIERPYQTCNRGDKKSCGSKVSHILRLQKKERYFVKMLHMSPNSSGVMKMAGCLVNDVLHWSNHALSPLHRVIKRSQWHQPNTRQWDLLDMHLLSHCTMPKGWTMIYSCNLLFEWQISKYSFLVRWS